MKLGFICDPTNNAYYRAIYPLRALERRGHQVVWPENLGEDLPMRKLAACDLVHCYRSSNRLPDIRRLTDYGVAVVFDNDDNYAAAEVSAGGTGLKGKRFNQELAKDMLKMALQAHQLTTPSPILAETYRSLGVQNVAVIGNHLDTNMFGFGKPSPHEGVVIGWVAAREHSIEMERMPIVDVLRDLLEKYPEVRVLTVGLKLRLPSDRYEHIPVVPLPQLLKVIKRLDIGIAPLVDVPFNHSRSDVKLKEYASGGATWVASNVGPYCGLGSEQGGMVVEDEAWPQALERLVSSRRQRKQLSKRAQRWARQQAIESRAGDWERIFRETITRVRG